MILKLFSTRKWNNLLVTSCSWLVLMNNLSFSDFTWMESYLSFYRFVLISGERRWNSQFSARFVFILRNRLLCICKYFFAALLSFVFCMLRTCWLSTVCSQVIAHDKVWTTVLTPAQCSSWLCVFRFIWSWWYWRASIEWKKVYIVVFFVRWWMLTSCLNLKYSSMVEFILLYSRKFLESF